MSIVIFIALSFLAPPVFAYDLTITCGASSCVKDTDTPLFSSSVVWYPGYTASRTVHFVNTTSDTRTLSTQAVNSAQTGDIDTVMQFLLKKEGSATSIWDNTLRTLYTASPIGLPDIPPNGTVDLIHTITMNPMAGNEFQNMATSFDLAYTISGIADPVVIQTVTGGNTDGGGGTSTTQTTGASAPFLPITQFLTFFNPIEGEVAGAEAEITPPPIPEEGKIEGDVAGTTTCQTCYWWPLLVLQALLTFYYYRRLKDKSKKSFLGGGAAVALFTYAVFLFINRDCRNGWQFWISSSNFWCKYFILWVLIVFGAISSIMKPKKEEKAYEVPKETPKKS